MDDIPLGYGTDLGPEAWMLQHHGTIAELLYKTVLTLNGWSRDQVGS